MKVNMKQISEITGVSTATVSNALNYKKGVNANTAAKGLKVAYELGYFEESRITKVKFVKRWQRSGGYAVFSVDADWNRTGMPGQRNGYDHVYSGHARRRL